MARVAIVVEFTLKAGPRATFGRLVREHARRTLEEPGCERFDVLQPLGSPSARMARPTRAAAYCARSTDTKP